jgi:hypothetical protein
MGMHIILEPNMIRVGHAIKDNGTVGQHNVCHVTKVCLISLTHHNKVFIMHECYSW